MAPPPRTVVVCALATGAWLASCAPHHPAVEPEPPEVFVEVLPRRAEVTVNGAPLGRGGRVVPVPDPHGRYVFRATAAGFAPAERSDEGARLAGARIALVLRPMGLPGARRLDLEDPESLVAAALELLRGGDRAAAVEYAERAVEQAPRAPYPHRVLAEAALALGSRERAITEYERYLRLAPDAADRSDVERQVRALRGGTTAPGVELRRSVPDGGGSG